MTPLLSSLAVTAFVGLATLARAEPKLGLQTWTCRNMTFEQVLDFAQQHDITELELIAAHLNPEAPREETLRKKAMLEKRGLHAYTFGVATTSRDPEKNRQLFEFARLMGMKVIVIEPKDPAEWDQLEQLVKEYDIKVAIHNHGTGTVYGDPATVRKVLAARDHRIGVCLDVGWVTAAGFDAAEVFRRYGDRVYDIHFKDKTRQTSADGKNQWVDTDIGRGQTNYAGLVAALKQAKWSGVMAIETDSNAFAADPNHFVSEAKRFFDEQKF